MQPAGLLLLFFLTGLTFAQDPRGSGKGFVERWRIWWALVDDLRTLPPAQIVAGIPHIGELSPL